MCRPPTHRNVASIPNLEDNGPAPRRVALNEIRENPANNIYIRTGMLDNEGRTPQTGPTAYA